MLKTALLILMLHYNGELKENHVYHTTVEDVTMHLFIPKSEEGKQKYRVVPMPRQYFNDQKSCTAFGKKLAKRIEGDPETAKLEDFSGYGLLPPFFPVFNVTVECRVGTWFRPG